MSKPEPARYRTTNWSDYNAALRKRGSLPIWLDKEMAWFAPHDGSPDRPAVFSNAAIQFCLSIKVLFKLPLRQAAGMVASLLRLAGLDWPVPDYSTLCRRQKTLKVQIPYRRAGGPLNLLVDSTGIKFLGDGEWQARKHGVQGRRQWRKVHLAMDTATSDIRAVEFSARSRPRAAHGRSGTRAGPRLRDGGSGGPNRPAQPCRTASRRPCAGRHDSSGTRNRPAPTIARGFQGSSRPSRPPAAVP